MTPSLDYFRQLGKAAALRITSRMRSVKVNKPNSAAAMQKAIHDPAPDARQLPTTYGVRLGSR